MSDQLCSVYTAFESSYNTVLRKEVKNECGNAFPERAGSRLQHKVSRIYRFVD